MPAPSVSGWAFGPKSLTIHGNGRAFDVPAAEQVLTVAVFNFETPDETVRDLGPKIATLINATLSAEPQIITVERAELEKWRKSVGDPGSQRGIP
jgi:hypothetical protein